MSEHPTFPDHLRTQLVAAAHRRRTRRRRTFAAVATAGSVAVAVAVISALGATSDPAAAEVDVVVADGVATIRLVDLEYRPEVIEEEIRRVGLDIDVVAVPSGPSNVGRFFGDVGDDAPVLELVDAHGSSFAGFSIPVDWPGSLELNVGRPATDGEQYVFSSDAYAPGEPLSCQGVYGLTAAEAAARLADLGLDASFQPYADDGVALPQMTPAEVAGGEQRSWRVGDALATSPERVVLTITTDGRPPSPYPLNDDQGACHE